MFRNKRQTTRQGVSLLELIAATTIIILTLVPALGMMRDSLRIGREIETNTLMATLCVNKMEEQLVKTSAKWEESDVTDDFEAEGYPGLNYRMAVRSDDGGSPGSLMVIEATVWDGNNEEHRVVFATKLAKVASYEFEALGL